MPDGKIAHARVKLGDSMVMMSLPHEPWPARPAMLYHYVADIDATYQQALAAGGESVFAPMNTFYGDRFARRGRAWKKCSRLPTDSLHSASCRKSELRLQSLQISRQKTSRGSQPRTNRFLDGCWLILFQPSCR
jgi:hypothetical protein